MQVLRRSASQFRKWWLVVFLLTFAPAALAGNIWYVDGVNGNDNNDCMSSQTACQTIGHAISLASSGDSIMVAPATYTENLTISFNLKVFGSSAATTIVNGSGGGSGITISGGTTHVVLSKLTVRGGSPYKSRGGGINNHGTLTLAESVITNNVAKASHGGGIFNGGAMAINKTVVSGNYADWFGGGIFNSGTLLIDNTTVSGNTAMGIRAGGGGIFNDGMLTITNSTVSNNHAGSNVGGGGIQNASQGTVLINNVTISGNSSLEDGAAISSQGMLLINNGTISGNSSLYGGVAISSDGTAILQNSILANLGGNCSGTVTSDGYNLSSDDTCNFTGPGDMNNTDPKLGGLGYNGGPTQTIPLLSGSPAIDGGNPNGCTDSNGKLLTTDQRGWPRPGKYDTGPCDMGAYELQTEIGPAPVAH